MADVTKKTTVERKRRKSVNERQGNLTFPEIPGYHCRLVLMDDPNKVGRVTHFENNLAYTTVTPEEVGESGENGSVVTRPAGGGRKFILMKTPIEEYNEGQKEKAEQIDETLRSRTRKNTKGDHTNFSQTIETN